MLALALVHHLAIGNNVPLPSVARLFARMAPRAIVEFVPKDDPMTRRLLAARPDIFEHYDIDGFRDAFGGRSGSCARRRSPTRRARCSCSSASDAPCALRTTARIDSLDVRSLASSS